MSENLDIIQYTEWWPSLSEYDPGIGCGSRKTELHPMNMTNRRAGIRGKGLWNGS